MKKVISLMFACMFMFTSCAKKEFLYLADMTESAGYVVANRHQSRIQSDDRLKITVSCKNPELTACSMSAPATSRSRLPERYPPIPAMKPTPIVSTLTERSISPFWV